MFFNNYGIKVVNEGNRWLVTLAYKTTLVDRTKTYLSISIHLVAHEDASPLHHLPTITILRISTV